LTAGDPKLYYLLMRRSSLSSSYLRLAIAREEDV